ncbi:MAG: hypothetical protein HZB10_00595 [Candidatus Yonathbacteria bacterium]|nr:hypothetical protein [Candidatus Yonathbacteria bacterium]
MASHRMQRVMRVILIIIPVVLFFWLLARDFVITGTLVVERDFSHPSPFIRDLRLPTAVYPIAYDGVNGDFTQRIAGDRLTFDVQLPRRFERATVELRYQKNAAQQFRLGMQRRKDVISPELHDLALVGTDGPWMIGTTTFERLEQFDFSQHRYQVLLDAPRNKQTKEGITLTSIRITFEREPWTTNNFFPRVWNFFKRK